MQTQHTIDWMDSVDQAEIEARDTEKLLLIDLFNPK
jgi:hypothetical protein